MSPSEPLSNAQKAYLMKLAIDSDSMAGFEDTYKKMVDLMEYGPKPETTGDKAITSLLERCRLSLETLKGYIDQMPGNNPVVWIGDQKTPVTKMPDYTGAAVLINELKHIVKH